MAWQTVLNTNEIKVLKQEAYGVAEATFTAQPATGGRFKIANYDGSFHKFELGTGTNTGTKTYVALGADLAETIDNLAAAITAESTIYDVTVTETDTVLTLTRDVYGLGGAQFTEDSPVSDCAVTDFTATAFVISDVLTTNGATHCFFYGYANEASVAVTPSLIPYSDTDTSNKQAIQLATGHGAYLSTANNPGRIWNGLPAKMAFNAAGLDGIYVELRRQAAWDRGRA